MLKIQHVYKAFDGRQVVTGLNLTIQKGEKVAIIGPSGIGKSTLLRLMMGLHKPDRGHILIDDVDLGQLDLLALRAIRRKFGMLFQSAALFDSMSVSENVAFPLVEDGRMTPAEIKKRVGETLSLVEMEGSERLLPANLSGGQRKRIGLARAIVAQPEILLYDEPTTGLDPVLSTNIEDLITKMNNHLNITSVVVTHQISTILRTTDRIYMMQNGKLLAPETPKTIYDSPNEYIRNFIRGGLS